MKIPCNLSLFQCWYSMNQIFCMCMSFTYSFDSILVNDHGTVIKIVILKQKTATICLVTFCENILFKNRNKTVFPQKNLVNIGQIDMMHCICWFQTPKIKLVVYWSSIWAHNHICTSKIVNDTKLHANYSATNLAYRSDWPIGTLKG